MSLLLVQERTPQNPQEITEKYGLEAGLWNTIRNKSSGISAKDLLKRYGGAYLLTSISLSIVSFTLCYLAVDRGARPLAPALCLECSAAPDTCCRRCQGRATEQACPHVLTGMHLAPAGQRDAARRSRQCVE